MIPILNLNKHPKDCKNLSLISANNVRLSKDGSCLQSEESIILNNVIDEYITNYYQTNYTIKHCIPCNKELIIFAFRNSDTTRLDIFRYNEELNECKLVYYDLTNHYGKITGTFTYNVNNELIIAFSEYDGKEDIPLQTINLGKFEDRINETSEALLSINPEVIIPTLLDYNYIAGNLPKGWYYIFVRYKIDNNDYTKWFDIAGPILVDDLEKQSIFKLYGFRYFNKEYVKFSSGALDHFSSKEDYANESIKLELNNLDNRYNNYQIAFICTTNTNIISHKSVDININNNNYIFDLKIMEEYDYKELISNNYNFFNVKNIINYENRLYIANYKEKLLDNYDTSNIKVGIIGSYGQYEDVKMISYSPSDNDIETYLSVDTETNYSSLDTNDTASAIIYKDLVVGNTTYNTLIESEDNLINLKRADSTNIYTINFYDNRNLKTGIEFVSGGVKIKENFKIKTNKGQLLNVEFYLEAYYFATDEYDNIYFKYTINNKSYYARCERMNISLNVGEGFVSFVIYETNITDDILIPTTSNNLSYSYINTKNSFNERRKNSTLLPGEVYSFYIHFVDKYGAYTKGFKINPKEAPNIKVIYNSNGDALFKINYSRPIVQQSNNSFDYRLISYRLNISNVDIPDGYIGYFISYERFESTSKVTGLLSKYDFNNTIHSKNDTLKNHNKEDNSKMYFYCSDFDIDDSFELKFNKLRIERKNVFKAGSKDNIIHNAIVDNIINLNVIESSGGSIDTKYYSIEDYDIQIAGDVIKNRFGLGTSLEIPIIDELFPKGNINLYKASLLYESEDIYVSKDKELIKCTNVIYPDLNNNIIQYLNGKHTYNCFLVYDNNKFIYNTTNTQIYAENNKEYIDYGNPPDTNHNGKTAKPLVYIQMPVFKDYFYETKSFKNNPQAINFRLDVPDSTKDYNVNTKLGLIVTPQDTINLFENKLSNPNNYCPKIYTNNRTDIKYLTEFDKFIRRSDIIKDESLSNSWRNFGLENYKVISENKGKITNLIGIGYYLLVHTEHSIFMFDSSNTIKAIDQDIQLATPDIFDLNYRELVTSELGYCGLQDENAYVLDQFGYIFYDNDSHRLYKFDAGQLNTIDDDIKHFLLKYKPNKIRFANDKISDRILLNIDYRDVIDNKNITLSYNYNSNSFISFHNYLFVDAYNTKNILYYKGDDGKLHNIDYNNLNNVPYNKFSIGNNLPVINELKIIINENYNHVKFLEYIIYKLYKIKKNTTSNYNDYPVEELRTPYSGNTIRIYNNEIDTGPLNINITTEEAKNVFANYDKPHWNLGNWNFNYLRNNLANNQSGDLMSRLYGNYFIVNIVFGYSEERIEFESLGYNFSKDKIM